MCNYFWGIKCGINYPHFEFYVENFVQLRVLPFFYHFMLCGMSLVIPYLLKR